MPELVVYVDRSNVNPGKLEELKEAVKELATFVEANEPRLIGYHVYFNEESTLMSVVHVHPDAASLAWHMEVIGPLMPRFADLVTMQSIDVYGSPDDDVRDRLQQKARTLGGGRVAVHRLHAGVRRLPGGGWAGGGVALAHEAPAGASPGAPADR